MNITQLKADINFLCGSTSATYPDSDKVRNINIAYQTVATVIWESEGGWQYDDSNATSLPVATTTLVHNQQDYALPSTAQRVKSIIVKDKGGTQHKLKEFDIYDTTIALPEFNKTPGLPVYYDLVGRSITLYPTPHSASVTLVSGLTVYVNRDVTEFATTASTETPGFATGYHRILSYAAALDFSQDETQRQFLAAQKARLERGMVRFYSKRDSERPTSIRPAQKKNWRKYT